MASYLRPRRGKKSTAETQAIVLKKGEVFFEIGNNGTPTTGASATAFGKIKMGDGTSTYSNLGYFIDVDTSTVDWDNTGYATATSQAQGADLYGNLNAVAPTATLKSILGNVKALLYKLSTQVTTLNNDINATFIDGGGTTTQVPFNFTYNASEESYGYLDEQGNFVSFNQGGPDISDTTATAQTVLSGYVFYNAQGSRTEGNYVPLDTSDATAYAKNIENGFTAYCRGEKITGIAVVQHGLVKYSGSITLLSVSRSQLAATSNSNYALFGGGYYSAGINNNISYDTVDAYNSSLSRSIPTTLSEAKSNLAAASIGDYALFGGGALRSNPYYSSTVDAYNLSLVRSNPTALSVARSSLVTASNPNYVLFGGGSSNSSAYSNTVDAYNSSLSRSIPTTLSVGRYELAATSNTDYALFGGGYSSGSSATYYNTVEAYNSSLSRSTPTTLSVARNQLAAANLGNCALFGGGNTKYSPYYSDTVEAYNTSLSRSILTTLSVARNQLAATNIGNYVLFGGGSSSSSHSNTVDVYNSSLVRSTPTPLSVARSRLVATHVGNYAIFGGGNDMSTFQNIVDAYVEV